MPTGSELTARARALWEELASVPIEFGPPGAVRVAVAPSSRLSPPSRLGAVVIGGLFRGRRARIAASRRVAAALGFRELGTRLSVELIRGVGPLGAR
ncbi:hypothetical protein [Streptomyces sp. DW26H14]|uniref:hypothetical protein n=1 Tax=Streptomyces sp. DW26H14 TaxID=3435395 RepID=UPI00403DE4F1